MDIFITLFIVFGMAVAAVWDVKTHKIPNFFTFPMMLFGFMYHGATSGLSGLGFSAAGIGVGIGVFLVPYLMEGMGAGDAKLMGATGSILGPQGVLIAAVISIAFGGIYAMILLAIHHGYSRSLIRRVGTTIKTFLLTGQFVLIPPGLDERRPVLSYAIPIALSTMCYLFVKMTGSDLIQQFLGCHFSL